MQTSVIAVDLAKSVFQVHGFSPSGERVLSKRVSRKRFQRLMGELPLRCEVVMEACASAHFWGRWLQGLGYRVRLIPTQHVRAYVVGNKTDGNDADAIYEASGRRNLRAVPVKSVEQQDVLLAHRIRQRRMHARVALVNQIRGLLAERGMVCGRGIKALGTLLGSVLQAGPTGELSAVALEQLSELQAEWSGLDEQIAALEAVIHRHVRDSASCQQLMAIPGIGPLSASATVALVGDASAFSRGRQLAAWMGLTPKEHSSGQSRRLGAITKRGDPYLRMLFIQGAHAMVRRVKHKEDCYSRWVQALVQRRGYHKAVVAVANKNARIVYALLSTGECYRPAA